MNWPPDTWLTVGVSDYADFTWVSTQRLADLAGRDLPWGHYLQTRVHLEDPGQAGTVWPSENSTEDSSPLGPLHVVTAIQPDSEPGSNDSAARMAVLDQELRDAGIRSIRAIGSSFDGLHSEDSRAVFGLDDAQARALGVRFGQVAVFGWSGPRFSLLACATGRRVDRGWRWEPAHPGEFRRPLHT